MRRRRFRLVEEGGGETSEVDVVAGHVTRVNSSARWMR